MERDRVWEDCLIYPGETPGGVRAKPTRTRPMTGSPAEGVGASGAHEAELGSTSPGRGYRWTGVGGVPKVPGVLVYFEGVWGVWV